MQKVPQCHSFMLSNTDTHVIGFCHILLLGMITVVFVTLTWNGCAGETVAIKSVDASNFRSIAQIDQIQDEISVLSGLKHPCIIRLLDMHFTNNIFYFVMEYAAGGCLVDYVRKQVSLTSDKSGSLHSSITCSIIPEEFSKHALLTMQHAGNMQGSNLKA